MKTTIESSGRMHDPAHPGEILKEMYMGPLGVTITRTAEGQTIGSLMTGRTEIDVSPAERSWLIRRRPLLNREGMYGNVTHSHRLRAAEVGAIRVLPVFPWFPGLQITSEPWQTPKAAMRRE